MSRPKESFEELVAKGRIEELMTHFRSFRGRSWSKLVRLVLCIKGPADLKKDGQVRWEKLALKDLDAPVDLALLQAWLLRKPPTIAVRRLSWLFDLRDPHEVTLEQLHALIAEINPDLLLEVLSSRAPHDAKEQALYARCGVQLGEACVREKQRTKNRHLSDYLQFATDEAKGVYLRDAAKLIEGAELTELGRLLSPKASKLPTWIKEAYAKALSLCAAKQKEADSYHLFVYTNLLDAAGIEATLRAVLKRPEVFQMVAAQVASQGAPQAADALSMFLDDQKLGRAAAMALASMGKEGVRAAEALLKSQKKATPGTAFAKTIRALPTTTSIWAGNFYSLPRFGHDPLQDLLSGLPAPTVKTTPTALSKLQEALSSPLRRELLPREAWADLLQILALDPQLADLEYSYTRAKGRLGYGVGPEALVAALDDLHWDCHIPSSRECGVGHLLLWAEASREVYLHAIARFQSSREANVLGKLSRHFGKALEEEKPLWAQSVKTLLDHYSAWRNETAYLGPPPVLASVDKAAPSVALEAPALDLWIRGEVRGAKRFTIKLRKSVSITVDTKKERWKVSKPSREGAAPPLDAAKGVSFVLETARDMMYLGINGALVSPSFEGLPTTIGPIQVEAEGEQAKVTRLELLEKYSVAGTDAGGDLLITPQEAQTYANLAGMKSTAAAQLLAAAALLLEGSAATMAREALSSMKGEGLEPWKRAVEGPEDKKRPKPKAAPFSIRSFEEVVADFEALKLGVKSRKPPQLKRGQTEHGDYEYASFGKNPATEDWGSHKAVPYPAVYLSEEEPSFTKLDYFIDNTSGLPALCLKGRGTSAHVSYVFQKGKYYIASLDIFPPDDGYGFDNLMDAAIIAAWKVEEGWAYAVLPENEQALCQLMGLSALPAKVEWKSERDVTVGNW